MSTPCLRCGKALEDQQVDTVQARFCGDCKVMLIRHGDLIQVLEQSWRSVPEKVARVTDFHATDALTKEPIFACPDCGQPMEKYGYLGFSAIPIDRCDPCSLVWLDADDLQNMVLALAKNMYRVEQRQKAAQDEIDVGSMGLAMAANSRQIWLFAEEDAEGHLKGSLAEAAPSLLFGLLRMMLRL